MVLFTGFASYSFVLLTVQPKCSSALVVFSFPTFGDATVAFTANLYTGPQAFTLPAYGQPFMYQITCIAGAPCINGYTATASATDGDTVLNLTLDPCA